jgi:hypothetical protein
MDLRITHDRVGSSTDPNLNGHLKYPNNLDQSLNDAAADKTRKYRADYNNRPPTVVSFMTAIPSTSGRLHSEFVRLLFLQAHRETDRFFAAPGVPRAQLLGFTQTVGTVTAVLSLARVGLPRCKLLFFLAQFTSFTAFVNAFALVSTGRKRFVQTFETVWYYLFVS